MTMSRLSLLTMTVLSVLVALATYRFTFLGLALSFPDMPEHIEQRRLAFLLHISASPVALVLGTMQFFARLRVHRPVLHQWTGRIYGAAILIGAVSGGVIALSAEGGIVAILGFGLLSILWVAFTGNAIRLAMAGRIAEHRRWMIRSFALTFAAVTLRLYLLGFAAGGIGYTEASVYLAWLCWVPNLLFVELWLLRRQGAVTAPDMQK